MGVVYEAEQDRPRRTVALKVIKPGFASPNLLRRFELEAEALGRLQHPGIAQIFEAGMADTGYGLQPYFAMEFIGGEPLCSMPKVSAEHAATAGTDGQGLRSGSPCASARHHSQGFEARKHSG